MKMFTLIIEDRHTDVKVKLFSNVNAAIAAAKAEVQESGAFDLSPEQRHDDEIGPDVFSGALYSYCYSSEGDMVRVMEIEVDSE